jgi:YegS/Rv2252/BmrU family lipid kinase
LLTVILNPASGSAARHPDFADRVRQLFRAAGRDVRIVQFAGSTDLTKAVESAINDFADVVVAAGGDGTVSSVASALTGRPTPLGVLPLGTWNHFARDAGIPLDLEKAVQTVTGGLVTKVDVVHVNGRFFLNNSSIGVYPSIVERREELRGKGHSKWVSFATATMETLNRAREVTVRIDAGGHNMLSRTPFVFVGNNEYEIEGIRLGARKRLNGGLLFAYLAPPMRTRDLPKLLGRALLGRLRQDHTLEAIAAPELWINTPRGGEMLVACDGELVTLDSPLHYRISPAALNVLVPAG